MNASVKKQAIKRLQIAAGQIRGLERMIVEDKYCIDIIHQSLAVKKALSSFEDFILENHLTTHGAEQMKSGRKKKAIQEIIAIYKLSKQK
ncbi:MAG TPA: metal-sensing transcriptional repressor [Candidatus Paceibacterota bacterium]